LYHAGRDSSLVHNDIRVQLSVLDQSPIAEGSTAGDALRNTIDLARWAEQLGYYRYWLAEHHGTPGLADASPEVLVGPVASATSRMHVGTGGIMLPHYSPLKVAETFSMLSALYPGRIDLGLGRAPGTSSGVAYALQRDRRQPAPDDFHEQLQELLGYLENRGPAAGPFRQTSSIHFESPESWLLGSSAQSGTWAAELGLPYVFADFINPNGAAIAAHYREYFEPSARLQEPRVGVATWAICAETDEEAQRLASSMRMLMLMLYRGRLIPVPSPEHALEFLANEGVAAETLPVGRRITVGTPEKVRATIEEVAEEYGADEVFVVNIMHDHAARKRSYELIARVFGMA
jgi:luciferase family oxidoreductase group 1